MQEPNQRSEEDHVKALSFGTLWKAFFKQLLLDDHIDTLRGAIKRRERLESVQCVRFSGESLYY